MKRKDAANSQEEYRVSPKRGITSQGLDLYFNHLVCIVHIIVSHIVTVNWLRPNPNRDSPSSSYPSRLLLRASPLSNPIPLGVSTTIPGSYSAAILGSGMQTPGATAGVFSPSSMFTTPAPNMVQGWMLLI
jgi:hypothetical protein